jgi:hypothetical protein
MSIRKERERNCLGGRRVSATWESSENRRYVSKDLWLPCSGHSCSFLGSPRLVRFIIIILAMITFISIQNSLFLLRHPSVCTRTTSNTHQHTLVSTFILILSLTVTTLNITTNQNAMLLLIIALGVTIMTRSFPRPLRAILPTRTWCLLRKGIGTSASLSITPTAHMECLGFLFLSLSHFRLPPLRFSSRHRHSRIIPVPLLNCPSVFRQL